MREEDKKYITILPRVNFQTIQNMLDQVTEPWIVFIPKQIIVSTPQE